MDSSSPKVFTSKFRIVDSSAGRNWTDSDILHLIEAYRLCRYASRGAGADTDDGPAGGSDRPDGRPETADALFERVHAVFVRRALNANRTAKSLHEKFGFLTMTYRRIRDYEAARADRRLPAWWELSVKEQRQHLSKSMTPISEVVFRALAAADDGRDAPPPDDLAPARPPDDRPPKRARTDDGPAGLAELTALVRQTADDQRARDEQLLASLNAIGQMVGQLCTLLAERP
ncbi:uncharacterized protein V1510DRAFT_432099 [Dipodascopsis tothii]|uniref:uncharacterized protein n=1 Tax=Dipodascopsis tothii TaxID=44089 RepID=UPI0034CFB052